MPRRDIHRGRPEWITRHRRKDFYEAAYFTERQDDEILTSISFSSTKGGYAYEKQKRKIGDYATAASAVLIEKDNDTCTTASIAMTNLSDTPVCPEEAARHWWEPALTRRRFRPRLLRQ